MADPLRIKIIEGDDERIKALGSVQAGSLIANPGGRLLPEGVKSLMQNLKTVGEKGYAHDFATALLGLRQATRYSPSGADQADALQETLFATALNADPKVRLAGSCQYPPKDCNTKPIQDNEIAAIVAATNKITEDMNNRRVIPMNAATAYVVGRLQGYIRPEVGTAGLSIPEASRVSLVRNPQSVLDANRKQCLENPQSSELPTCVLTGLRESIHHQAREGFQYKEATPMLLERRPDLTPEQMQFLKQRKTANQQQP
jgi:hypothetical protein